MSTKSGQTLELSQRQELREMVKSQYRVLTDGSTITCNGNFVHHTDEGAESNNYNAVQEVEWVQWGVLSQISMNQALLRPNIASIHSANSWAIVEAFVGRT